MPITVRPPIPNSIQDNVALPPKVPQLPEDIFERWPSLREYQEKQNKWWIRTTVAIQQFAGSVGDEVDSRTSNTGDLFVQFNDFTAAITTELSAIADELGAQAKRIVTVSAMAGVSQHIKVQTTAPVAPALNDYWVNNTDLTKPITYQWDGAAWVEVTTPISAAAVADERTARATADGNLEGKYTLTVIAGDVVTGMNITSASGPGGNISSVIFRATDFKIYDGTLGVTPFQVIGGTVRVSGLTIVGSDIVGGVGDVTLTAINGGLSITGGGLSLASGGAAIRGGQTAYNTGSGFWMGDVAGTTKFSIGNPAGSYITWDGAALTITGGAPSVAWTSITGRPTELTDGRIAVALSAAGLVVSGVVPGINVTTGGAGLYLGANFMGYYNGSVWKTYMDNTGNFYLGGTSGALTWNGTTLAITGTITSTSGTIGGFTLGTDFLHTGAFGTFFELKAGLSPYIRFGTTGFESSYLDRETFWLRRSNNTDFVNFVVGGCVFDVAVTISTGGLNISSGQLVFIDTNLYRSAANTLKTDDNFIVAGNLTVSGAFSPGSVSTGAISGTTGAFTSTVTINGVITATSDLHLSGTLTVGTFSPAALTVGSLTATAGISTPSIGTSSGNFTLTGAGTAQLVMNGTNVVCLTPLKLNNAKSAGSPTPGGTITVIDSTGATISLITT